ncbi:hypothetical protein STAS_04585 [Striga asiatica]|uniref:Uncharacterized protein n=1 Tax=Striga asiatica TaxID=4170 RepID=A0A5A7P7Z1_STRAF|nr:hypothetical protein STAS_04585 [Striga asiatica]
MEHFAGGNWGMIPNMEPPSNPATPSNQDHLFLPQQQQPQFNHQQQQFQQQFNQQPPQSQPQPRYQNQPPPPATQQQQQHQHQSLASHFHLLHLVENLADVTENGTRDQQADALVGDDFGSLLVAELNTQFEKCQQLLNSIGGTIKAKSTRKKSLELLLGSKSANWRKLKTYWLKGGNLFRTIETQWKSLSIPKFKAALVFTFSLEGIFVFEHFFSLM